jgi:hypothetical protein
LGPVPVLEPVEAVVGDAAAGLAVVPEVDGRDVAVVELGAEAEVSVGAGLVAVVDEEALSAAASRLSSPPLQAGTVRAIATARAPADLGAKNRAIRGFLRPNSAAVPMARSVPVVGGKPAHPEAAKS